MAAYLNCKNIPLALVMPFDGTTSFSTPANVGRLVNLTQRKYALLSASICLKPGSRANRITRTGSLRSGSKHKEEESSGTAALPLPELVPRSFNAARLITRSPKELTNLVRSEGAILVCVHGLEDALVSA
jgi:hypothetical protein